MERFSSTCLAFLAFVSSVGAFTTLPCRSVTAARRSTPLFALTERQRQFWEDVDEGLDEIAAIGDIQRIRDFALTAQGKSPLPSPAAPGHQPSEEHVNGLTAMPFWDVAADVQAGSFPWARPLEAQAHIVVEELQAKLTREAEERRLFTGDSAWQNDVMGTGWSAFRLQRLGVWNEENCSEFPLTTKLLLSLDIPFAVRGVCFARQGARSGVRPHTDGRNFILTSHLGLQVPVGCWIKAGGEERSWEEGRLTTLDTSFEHSTGNPTDADRHVLIIDTWHPELTPAERAGLEFVYNLRNRFEAGQVPLRRPRTPRDEGGITGLGVLFGGMFGRAKK